MANVLCIDDEPSGIQARRLLLEAEGFQVIDASTGEEGIRLFQSSKIDVVVVDYWISGMNGLAVAREIKRLDLLGEARILGHEFEIIAKPIRPRTLLAMIRFRTDH